MNLVKVFPRQHRQHKANPSANREGFNAFDQLFNDLFGESFTTKNQTCAPKTQKVQRPAINILESDDNFNIELVAPSFSKKDFTLNVENDFLTISAKKEVENEENEKFILREFKFTELERKFQLPETVNQEDIKATFNNGILTITLAKKEEAKPVPARTIEIG